MALLYSYQNREPAPLPERIRMPDGMTVRPPLSAEQLGELGYAGPFTFPSFDSATQIVTWDVNDMTYRVLDIAQQDLDARARKAQEASANYRLFYDALISGSAYQEIRSQAIASLPLTVACTEFIAAMGDAKAGTANLLALQACIDGVLAAATLSDEHLQEIYTHLKAAGIWGLITLGDFEPEIPEPAPEPEPTPAPEPTPEPEAVVITLEDEGDDTVDLSGGTTSAGITSGSVVTGGEVLGGSGEDVVTFDDPLA